MVKRIVSGIFALAALAALGVIIGGALASGEQLIVRFLTAVIVAALALYVISDLRLKSEPPIEAATGANLEPRFPPRTAVPPASDSILESTVLTTDMATGHRDLRPAARTIDVVHPTQPPSPPPRQPATIAVAEVEPPPHMQYIDSPSVDVSSIDVTSNHFEKSSDPEPVVDDAIYLAVGTHTYEGGLETPAAEWPRSAPPTPEMPETNVDEIPPTGSEEAELLDLTRPLRIQEEPPTMELSAIPGDVAVSHHRREEQPLIPPLAPIDLDPDLLSPTPMPPAEESAAIVDLARTTASYAGPVQTPVIDLREPVTDEIPAASLPSHVDEQPTIPPLLVNDTNSLTPDSVANGSDQQQAVAPSANPTSQALAPSHDQRVAAAIAGGERKVVDTLIRQGMLTTDGPITDRDVRTMVYVAFTSNELRKIIMAGGRINTGNTTLGPVELFDESVFQPVPKTIYTGRSYDNQLPSPAAAGLIQKPLSDDREDAPV